MMPEVEDFKSTEELETLLHQKLLLPQNGAYLREARVIARSKDEDGVDIGKYNPNKVLDSRVYDVMFPDGAIEQYAANVIAENLLDQVDDNGYHFKMLEQIVGHRTDGTEPKERKGCVSTRGHQLKIQWIDGNVEWVPLKDMKEAYPVETAEYAIEHNLQSMPAFSWWVKHTLRRKERIVAAIVHKPIRKNFKYGHQVPVSVQEAYILDRKFNTTRWRDAIAKEMHNVRIAFKILEDSEKIPPSHEYVPCHLVFDVKMDGTFKARFVAAGCRTSDPEGSTYAGVVSRETVRLALLYAALNELNISAADILNAYLTAPASQKLWTKCGPEFGKDQEREQ